MILFEDIAKIIKERAGAQSNGVWTPAPATTAQKSGITYQDAVNDYVLSSYGRQILPKMQNYSTSPEWKQELADNINNPQIKLGSEGQFTSEGARTYLMDLYGIKSNLANEGFFDTREFALGGYHANSSTDFLKNLLEQLGGELETSKQKDADWDATGRDAWYDYQTRNSAIANKLAEMDAQGRNYYDTDVLEESDLLWFDQVVNGNQRWKPNYGLQEDVDRYNALVDQWAETDWETFSLADHLGIEAPQEYKSNTDSIQYQMDKLQRELGSRAEIERLTGEAQGLENFGELSQYAASDAFGEGFDPRNFTLYGDYAPIALHEYINTGDTNVKFRMMEGGSESVDRWSNAGYDWLFPDEIAVYNALYSSGDKAGAQQYLDALESRLLERRAEYQKMLVSDFATQNWLTAGLSFAGARASTLATAAAYPFMLIQANTEDGLDPNSPLGDSARFHDTVGGAQGQWLDENAYVDVGGKNLTNMLYNAFASGADSLTAMGVGAGVAALTGLPHLAGKVAGFIQNSNVGANTLMDDLANGWSNSGASLHSLATALLSGATEKYSIDAFFSDPKSFLLQVFKSGGIEMSEEGVERFLSPFVDKLSAEVTGNYAEWDRMANDLVGAKKFENKDEAMRAIIDDWMKQMPEEMFTSFISGSFLGGTSAGIQIGQDIGAGQAAQQNGDVDALISIGSEMAPDSDSYQAAQELMAQQDAGKKLSLRNIGKLVNSLTGDIKGQAAESIKKIYEESITKRLVELGEDFANATNLASALRKIANGETLTVNERGQIAWSDAADQVAKELLTETKAGDDQRVGHSWKTEMAGMANAAKAQALGKVSKANDALNAQVRAKAEAAKAAEETAKKADATATEVDKTAKEMVEAGKTKLEGASENSVAYETEDGSEGTGELVRFEQGADGDLNAVVKAQGADGKATETKVSIKDIYGAATEAVASVADFIRRGIESGRAISATEASSMLNMVKQAGENVQSYVSGFQRVYDAGYSGLDMPTTAMDANLAQIIYEQGKAEGVADEETRVKKAGKVRANSAGVVSWLGQVSSDADVKGFGSVDGLNEALGKMTSMQRSVVKIVQAYAQKFKTNIVLFESGADGIGRVQNGSYDPNTNTLYIDINSGANSAADIEAGKTRNTLGAAVLRTLGHELTHHLESTSAAAYANFKQAVKNELKKSGKDWATLVRSKIDAAHATGRKISYAEAESEVVADASEFMLQNTKFAQEIDESTRGKVKKFIQNFMQKLSDVFRNITGAHDETKAIRKLIRGVWQYTGDLQKLWDAAMDESIMAVQDGAVETTDAVDDVAAEPVKLSPRDADYLAAVERGDMETAQKMVDETAKAAGYEPVKLYHGTRQFGFTKFDTDKSDDKMSIFVTDDRRIAESYSREGANIPVKNGIKQERYDFMQQNSAKLEPYVQKWVDKNLKVPTERELRAYTDGESATILSAVDWVDDYLQSNWDSLSIEAKSAISKAMFYAEKLAAIPTADMEDETEGYALRMKFEAAVQDLAWEDRNSYEEIAPVLSRTVYESANNLISARFNDPFYNVNDGTFVSKWDVTDKLGEKLFTGIYELYGDMENLLEIDANDSNWNTIDGKTIGRDGVFITTREVAEFAKKNGFNGVKIKNVRDGGGMTGYHAASNVLIFFDSTALKSADPITYDDAGNVIPLSERFNTANEDIRYSRRDADYMDAVNNGDMETAQKLVDEAAVAAGYTVRAYHGSDSFGFTKFLPERSDDRASLFFAESPDVAGSYTANKNVRALGKPFVETKETKAEAERIIKGYASGEIQFDGDLYKVAGRYILESWGEDGVSITTKNSAEFVNAFQSVNSGAPVGGVYNAYLKLGRNLSVDARGNNWSDIYFVPDELKDNISEQMRVRGDLIAKRKEVRALADRRGITFSEAELLDKKYLALVDESNRLEEEYDTRMEELGLSGDISTRAISRYAKTHGYDSVSIANVQDIGKYDLPLDANGDTTVHIVFSSEQVKSADPVTYDDAGNVIPLSERFNAAQEDIRYSHRSDYQYTVDGARDFFGDDDTYHHFAKKASDAIAKNPRKKLHIVSVTQYGDDIFMCAIVNDGQRKYHLEDVAFIDVSGYNGRISTLIDRFERMYVKYGKERAAEFIGSVASDVRLRFFPVDRGRGDRTTQKSENRPRKEYRFESDGGDAGERHQRSGLPEGSGEVTDSPDGIKLSIRDLPSEVTAREFLADGSDVMAETVEEKNALTIYQQLLTKHAEASTALLEAERDLEGKTGDELAAARKVMARARARQNDLYNRLLKVERTAHVQSVINRTNQLITDVSGKTEFALAEEITALEQKVDSLKADITGLKGAAKAQREADIRENERKIQQLKSNAAKSLLANSERYQRQIADIRARRDLNADIGKQTRHIKRVVKRLNDRIVHEEDYKNVKEPLKPAVIRLVQEFIDGFGGTVFDAKTASNLSVVYAELAKEGEAPEFYSNDVAEWLQDLASMKEWDALIRAEGSSSLSAAYEKLALYTRVAEIADHIYKMVKDADEVFINGKRESINAVSTETGTDLLNTKDSKLLVGKARDAYNVFQNLIVKGNLTPQYFFESLKNSGLKRLFDGLMRGQREYAQAIRKGQEFVSDAKKRYNYYAWTDMRTPVEFTTEQGHKIGLTREQMLWVYATAKREATNKLMDTHHLDEGGFKYEGNALPRLKGKMQAIPGSDRLHKISKGDVEKISAMLTQEQKDYADELVSYLSNECAAQGNKASMELFGIKKYNEEYYFPFRTADDQRYQRSDSGSASTTNDARVKHASFTHSLRKGAKTPLVMGDFTDVVSSHINLMATYSSFVVPIESMNRVLNTKVNDETDGSGSDVTIRSLVGRKHGEAAQKYIADLLKDLNGGPQVDSRGKWDAGIRLFKKNAVLGSLSVAVQQPTAYVRAFAFVDPKYFVHLTGERSKETMKRMMAYSGTAVLKEMGGFNVGMGKQAADWVAHSDINDYRILKRTKFLYDQRDFMAIKNNWTDFITALPGFMDRITWAHIWKAIEAEQADLNPGMDKNSEAFLKMVGERFDDVVNHTQVYDSILAKSQNMRGKDTLAKMATAFMAEPTLNMNMYYSAVRGGHGKKQASRIVASVVLSNALAAAAAAAVSAWNKDDDERTAIEQYMTSFAGRLADNLNPLGSIPYLSDIWSGMTGYEVERTDMSPIVDLFNYTTSFFDKAADGKPLTWRDYENFLGSWANLTGIPFKNLSRDARRVRNLVVSDKSVPPASRVKYGVLDEIVPWRDTTNTAYYERYLAALKDGDKQEQYDLKDYLMSTKGVKKETITSGVRDAYKAEFLRGGIAKTDAINFLLKNDLATGDTAEKKKQSAFQYVDRWSEGTDGYSAYNTLEAAFAAGSSAGIRTAWNELTSNGYTTEQVGEQSRKILKELVKGKKITPAKATEILKAWYPYKKDADNTNKPLEWLKETE